MGAAAAAAGGVGADDDDGGRGAKKRKRVTDDEVDGSFGSSYAAVSGKGQKRKGKAAAEDDDDDDEEEDDEEEEDDDEDDEEEEDDEEDDEEEEVGGADDDDDWEDDVEPVIGLSKPATTRSKADDADDEEDIEDDGDEEEEPRRTKKSGETDEGISGRAAKRMKKADKRVLQLASAGVNDKVPANAPLLPALYSQPVYPPLPPPPPFHATSKMPHKLACPGTLEDFDELVRQYVRSVPDMHELVSRITAWNSVHLPGAAGMENRGKMHNFLDVLFKVLVRVGDTLARARTPQAEVDVLAQLDSLCAAIYRLSQDLPDASPVLWGRTLKVLHGQLQKRLRDFVQGECESCWPSLGQLLLMRALGHVFAVTDFQHALVGPASLFLCQCLTQCPVRTSADVAHGLLACSVLAGYTRETRRIVPEMLEFVRSVTVLFSTAASSSSRIATAAKGSREAAVAATLAAPQKTFDLGSHHALAGMRAAATAAATAATSTAPTSATISWAAFSDAPLDAGTAAAILRTAQTLASELATRHADVAAFPELFAPLNFALRALRPQDAPALPAALQRSHADLQETIRQQAARCSETRPPLQWRKQAKVAIEAKNPKFQADYTFKKDRDPDESRAKLKQLTRQSKRETKAAMRELRRDSEFVDQLQFTEQTEKREKLRAERHKNFAWMEQEAATINLQVRKGGGLMKGGGSGVAKKARVKR